MLVDASLFTDFDNFEGFEPAEVADITAHYVCAQCYGTLVAYNIPGHYLYIVICAYCAENVELTGLVTKSTVSIRMEQGVREYNRVITNLKDLYPTLELRGITRTPLRKGETGEERNIRELGF